MTPISLSLTNHTALLPQSNDCSRYVKQINIVNSTALTAEMNQLCRVVTRNSTTRAFYGSFQSHILYDKPVFYLTSES